MRQFGCASLAVMLLAQSVAAAPRHHHDFVMAHKNTTSMHSPMNSPTSEDTGSVMTVMVSPIPATPTPSPTPMDSMGSAMDTPTDMSSDSTPTESPMMPPMVTPVGLPTGTTTPEDTPTETSAPETTAAPTSEPMSTEEPSSTEPSSSSPSSTSSSSKPNPSCAIAYSLHKNSLRAIRHPMNLPPAGPVKRAISNGSCKPGTYACLHGPEGWQVCDVSGNYQFAGNCPSNTHCQTYPSTGGLLCLPDDC